MAKINFQIDTEDSETHLQPSFRSLATKKVGLLPSITISDDLATAFLTAYGSNNHAKRHKLGYASATLKQGKRDLKNSEKCAIIATVGGGVVFKAIVSETDNPPFVSLFGDMPDLNSVGNCVGGISLNSWKSNAARVTYLTRKLTCPNNQVGLFYNSNSAMSNDETNDWNNNVSPPVGGVSSAVGFSGDLTQFGNDLARFPARVRAIVISADPLFLENKEALIGAANTWAQPANKYVCYPLQDYQNTGGTPPTSTKSTLYGPDLMAAYGVLGVLAKNAAEAANVGFFTASDMITEI